MPPRAGAAYRTGAGRDGEAGGRAQVVAERACARGVHGRNAGWRREGKRFAARLLEQQGSLWAVCDDHGHAASSPRVDGRAHRLVRDLQAGLQAAGSIQDSLQPAPDIVGRQRCVAPAPTAI